MTAAGGACWCRLNQAGLRKPLSSAIYSLASQYQVHQLCCFSQGGIGECRYLIVCDLGPVEVSGQYYQDSSFAEGSHILIRLPRLCKEPGGILTLSLLPCPLRMGCWSELLIRRKDNDALNKNGPNSKVDSTDSHSLLTATGACAQIHLINPWKEGKLGPLT